MLILKSPWIGYTVVALSAEVAKRKMHLVVALWLGTEVHLRVDRCGREPELLRAGNVVVAIEDDRVERHLALVGYRM